MSGLSQKASAAFNHNAFSIMQIPKQYGCFQIIFLEIQKSFFSFYFSFKLQACSFKAEITRSHIYLENDDYKNLIPLCYQF
jgi:hypothetical protein